uniref:Uncharacterized protein n=1 Tax=Arundo donax TaxID=35708 RepID=A0A0A9F0H9_ARUDO
MCGTARRRRARTSSASAAEPTRLGEWRGVTSGGCPCVASRCCGILHWATTGARAPPPRRPTTQWNHGPALDRPFREAVWGGCCIW